MQATARSQRGLSPCRARGAPLWARARGYRAAAARHERVHGAAMVEYMQGFFDCVDALFGAGRLGGCVVTARLPGAKTDAGGAQPKALA